VFDLLEGVDVQLEDADDPVEHCILLILDSAREGLLAVHLRGFFFLL
jgi:hypothetical protein